MNNQCYYLVIIAILVCTACYAEQPMAISSFGDTPHVVAAKTKKDIKSKISSKTPWLEVRVHDLNYMFAADDITIAGVSRHEIHGWVYLDYAKHWERILLVRTNDVGNMKLSVDSETGMFVAKGGANNKFKDKVIFSFDLRGSVH